MTSKLNLCGVVVAAVAACGSDQPPSDLQTAADSMAECERHCDAEVGRCESPDPEELAFCLETCADRATWIREDAALALHHCVEGVGCEDDGDCTGLVEPLDVHSDYERLCIDKLAACDGQGDLDPALIPCLCDVAGPSFVPYVAPSLMPALAACFDAACVDALACLERALPRDGVEFVFGWCASN